MRYLDDSYTFEALRSKGKLIKATLAGQIKVDHSLVYEALRNIKSHHLHKLQPQQILK